MKSTAISIFCLLLCFAQSSHGITLPLENIRRVQGTLTEDPAKSTFTNSVGMGSGNVGYASGIQWRSLVLINASAAVSDITAAYAIELTLDPDWANVFNGETRNWKVDYLGITSERQNTGTTWNGDRYNWETSPGTFVGMIDTSGLRLEQTFDVTQLVKNATIDSTDRYLVFRISGMPPETLGNNFAGALDTDLASQGLTVRLPDDRPSFSVSAESITLAELNGSASIQVVLDSSPSQNVVIGVSSRFPSVATVSESSLVFDSTNWDTPQSISIYAADDNAFGFRKGEIDLYVKSNVSAPAFTHAPSKIVSIFQEDNESPFLAGIQGPETFTATLEMEHPASASVVATAHMSPIWTHNGVIYNTYVDDNQNGVIAKKTPDGTITRHIIKTDVKEGQSPLLCGGCRP